MLDFYYFYAQGFQFSHNIISLEIAFVIFLFDCLKFFARYCYYYYLGGWKCSFAKIEKRLPLLLNCPAVEWVWHGPPSCFLAVNWENRILLFSRPFNYFYKTRQVFFTFFDKLFLKFFSIFLKILIFFKLSNFSFFLIIY